MSNQEKLNFNEIIYEICDKDKRYRPDAYSFIMEALSFTQKKINRQGHLSGGELLDGIKDFAIQQYGLMANTVLKYWGISNTLDFGNIVFNMIDKKLLSKTEEDSIDDFKDIYSFDAAFNNQLENITIEDIK